MTNETETAFEVKNQTKLDHKVIKKIYPRCNNKAVLEFVFERDPGACLQKNQIILHFIAEIDDGYTVENGWVAKLFSMLTIEIDSQIISSNKTRYLLDKIELYVL